MYFNTASLIGPEAQDMINYFHATECLPQEKQNTGNNRSLLTPVQ